VIRELRADDAPTLLALMQRDFPEEEALMGWQPDGFFRVVRRIYRWDARLLLGLAAIFGRRVFRFYVVEEDGRLVATTLLTYPARAGFVSMVAVDRAYRRRGLAKALLERARLDAVRAGRSYVALDVLATNAPARALYDALGFRPLRESRIMAWEGSAPDAPVGENAVRPFRRPDVAALLPIARRNAPPEVEEVLPVGPGQFGGGGIVDRALEGETAAWVVDRGSGPEAYLGASRSPAMTAAHLSAPIVAASADAAAVAGLVRTGVDWCARRGSPRIVSQVPLANATGRAALDGGGFHDALAVWTLYRPAS
jgi:ribosomal protein S18 acetylase RimI-like enzyme